MIYRVYYSRSRESMLASPFFKTEIEAQEWISRRANRQQRHKKDYMVKRVTTKPVWSIHLWIPLDGGWALDPSTGIATMTTGLTNELGEVAP